MFKSSVCHVLKKEVVLLIAVCHALINHADVFNDLGANAMAILKQFGFEIHTKLFFFFRVVGHLNRSSVCHMEPGHMAMPPDSWATASKSVSTWDDSSD